MDLKRSKTCNVFHFGYFGVFNTPCLGHQPPLLPPGPRPPGVLPRRDRRRVVPRSGGLHHDARGSAPPHRAVALRCPVVVPSEPGRPLTLGN